MNHVIVYLYIVITYSTTEPANSPSWLLFLSTANSSYASSISLVLTKEDIFFACARVVPSPTVVSIALDS
jgi:hypothetical protein